MCNVIPSALCYSVIYGLSYKPNPRGGYDMPPGVHICDYSMAYLDLYKRAKSTYLSCFWLNLQQCEPLKFLFDLSLVPGNTMLINSPESRQTRYYVYLVLENGTTFLALLSLN